MGIFDTMVETEREGLRNSGRDPAKVNGGAKARVVWLFVVVLFGICAHWAFEYIGAAREAGTDPTWPSAAEIVAQIIFAGIVGCLIFLNVYDKVKKPTSESWAVYFLAFQNGFFWQALFESVQGGFITSAG
jgi:hypothetical protein